MADEKEVLSPDVEMGPVFDVDVTKLSVSDGDVLVLTLSHPYPTDQIHAAAQRFRREMGVLGIKAPLVVLQEGDDLSIVKENTLSDILERVQNLEAKLKG